VERNDRRVEEMAQQGTSVIRIVQLSRTIGRTWSRNGKDKKFIHCSASETLTKREIRRCRHKSEIILKRIRKVQLENLWLGLI
jgi:hypothetical protein